MTEVVDGHPADRAVKFCLTQLVIVATYLPDGRPRYGSFATTPEPEHHRLRR
ncbi:MAG TPA: hypothetical protein VG317_22075 [Pseudonocardiaceae bacterium]|nr:hypothetical protein [Pseudonocardiaceae bacterium]